MDELQGLVDRPLLTLGCFCFWQMDELQGLVGRPLLTLGCFCFWQMDELQVLVRNYYRGKPDGELFPYSDEGETLVDFVRTVCHEHGYVSVGNDLNRLYHSV